MDEKLNKKPAGEMALSDEELEKISGGVSGGGFTEEEIKQALLQMFSGFWEHLTDRQKNVLICSRTVDELRSNAALVNVKLPDAIMYYLEDKYLGWLLQQVNV